jgi:hypothetical protein
MNRKIMLRITALLLGGLVSIAAYADRHDRDERRNHSRNEMHYDTRFHHDRYYPHSGRIINVLPEHRHRVYYHDHDYYFHAGVWYRPHGSSFIVVAPPPGIIVPILPPFYSTIWVSGIPYYYANDTYYVWRPDRNGYEVTAPPAQATQQEPPLVADQLFIYPTKGQSEQQQADDRYACHSWAVKQTGYDPTQPPEQLNNTTLNSKREDYQRAMKACLEGRGYSVR